MAYTTANGTETSVATAYSGEEVPEAKADPLLRDAERAVRDIAPPPSDLSGDDVEAYKQDASDAELYVFSAYVANPGYLSSASLDGVSISYAQPSKDREPINERVRSIMSRWIRGTPPRATVSASRYSNVLGPEDKW